MVYSEQLNMFSGVCKRTVSITVFEDGKSIDIIAIL